MTQPRAINPLNFFMFFEIVTGNSNTPGTRMILISIEFLISFFALLINPEDIFLFYLFITS